MYFVQSWRSSATVTSTEITMPTTAVAPISAAKNAGLCAGNSAIAAMKNTLVKWTTTGL